ncbi:MAG: hypothetical protein M1819_004516 [Sarea resinae]|nr:MAG: hypothetical protein M1819_004516 [Sarea resinae]
MAPTKADIKLIPSNPDEVMVIRNVTPNIVTCSVPFLRFGKIKIGGRGTIVRLPNNTLAVFSPVALTPAVQAEIAKLGGQVRYLAATDIEHHIFLSDWKAAFPTAKVLGPEGLPEKRAAQKNEHVDFDVVYKAEHCHGNHPSVDAEFDAVFDIEYVPVHPNKELVVNYRPDKTLIEADLMFNLPATEQYSKTGLDPNSGVFTKLFGAIQSAHGPATWQKRMLWYGFSSSNRDGFNKSVQRIAGWDFDKIIPCHGDVIETGGKGVFEKVFEWHLQGKK